MFSKPTGNSPQVRREASAPPLPTTSSTLAQSGMSQGGMSQGAPMSQQVRTPARAGSILAADLVFEGNISGDGELMIDGAVKGDVHVSRLVVGEHAVVEGTIRGAQIELRGRVHGNVEGKAVRLFETAHVEGDIVHEQLSIDVGAFFQGRCSQFRAPPVVAQPAPTPVAQVIDLDQQRTA